MRRHWRRRLCMHTGQGNSLLILIYFSLCSPAALAQRCVSLLLCYTARAPHYMPSVQYTHYNTHAFADCRVQLPSLFLARPINLSGFYVLFSEKRAEHRKININMPCIVTKQYKRISLRVYAPWHPSEPPAE